MPNNSVRNKIWPIEWVFMSTGVAFIRETNKSISFVLKKLKFVQRAIKRRKALLLQLYVLFKCLPQKIKWLKTGAPEIVLFSSFFHEKSLFDHNFTSLSFYLHTTFECPFSSVFFLIFFMWILCVMLNVKIILQIDGKW